MKEVGDRERQRNVDVISSQYPSLLPSSSGSEFKLPSLPCRAAEYVLKVVLIPVDFGLDSGPLPRSADLLERGGNHTVSVALDRDRSP